MKLCRCRQITLHRESLTDLTFSQIWSNCASHFGMMSWCHAAIYIPQRYIKLVSKSDDGDMIGYEKMGSQNRVVSPRIWIPLSWFLEKAPFPGFSHVFTTPWNSIRGIWGFHTQQNAISTTQDFTQVLETSWRKIKIHDWSWRIRYNSYRIRIGNAFMYMYAYIYIVNSIDIYKLRIGVAFMNILQTSIKQASW